MWLVLGCGHVTISLNFFWNVLASVDFPTKYFVAIVDLVLEYNWSISVTLRCWITQGSVTWLVGDNQLDTPRCFWWKSGLWGVCMWAHRGILKLISVCFLYLGHWSPFTNTCLQAWKNLIKRDVSHPLIPKILFNRLSLGLTATFGPWLCCKAMSFALIREATIHTCYLLKRVLCKMLIYNL